MKDSTLNWLVLGVVVVAEIAIVVVYKNYLKKMSQIEEG